MGGTNDVIFNWDGTFFNAQADYTGPGLPGSVANATISSATPFFGATTFWTAHDVQVFSPGTYVFDTTLGAGNPEGLGTFSASQFMTLTVILG